MQATCFHSGASIHPTPVMRRRPGLWISRLAVLHLWRRHGACGLDTDASIKMAYDVANAMEGAIGNHSMGDEYDERRPCTPCVAWWAETSTVCSPVSPPPHEAGAPLRDDSAALGADFISEKCAVVVILCTMAGVVLLQESVAFGRGVDIFGAWIYILG